MNDLKPTVLVTGGAGALGAVILKGLRHKGFHVRALQHRGVPKPADEIVRGDLGSGGSLRDACEGAHTVLHMGAITHARRRDNYWRVNADGTANLVRASQKTGVKRFVLVSSRAAVASGGAYSESKLAAERIVRRSGLPSVILRPAEVYGGSGGEGIAAIIDRSRRQRVIPLPGKGSHRVCPVHVDDLADAVVEAVTREDVVGSYVLSGPCMTLRELARTCSAVFESQSRIVAIPEHLLAIGTKLSYALPLPLAPDQLDRLRVSKPECSSSARSDLGFRPRDLKTGLASLVES